MRAAILEDERDEYGEDADGDGDVPPATGRTEDHREGGMHRTKEKHALQRRAGVHQYRGVQGRAEAEVRRGSMVCGLGGDGGPAATSGRVARPFASLRPGRSCGPAVTALRGRGRGGGSRQVVTATRASTPRGGASASAAAPALRGAPSSPPPSPPPSEAQRATRRPPPRRPPPPPPPFRPRPRCVAHWRGLRALIASGSPHRPPRSPPSYHPRRRPCRLHCHRLRRWHYHHHLLPRLYRCRGRARGRARSQRPSAPRSGR
jgi:hypothetical protein